MKLKFVFLFFCYCAFQFDTAYGQIYNIKEFGAVPDGQTISTKAIQKTIDECYQKGGGTVLVPAGTYRTGTIFLKSNINLQIENGATLIGSDRLVDYYEYTLPGFGTNHYGIIYADSCENVSISGFGKIDGNNEVFFEWDKAKKIEWGGVQYTRQKNSFREVKQGIGDGPVNPLDRPRQMIIFSRSRNIQIRNVQLINSPFWTLHFADCDGVLVTGIQLFTNMLVPNADGIDITSCSNVIISDCDIRAGDDAIAVTGYANHFELPGYHNLRHISENILISNCNLQSYSSAIRIGFLDQNTVRNIRVNNINITNSTRGIGIFLRDEGSLENISFTNINIQTALRTGDWWGNGEPIHISAVRGNEKAKLGQIKNIKFDNIICKGENGILLYGSEESRLKDISISNLSFELMDSPLNESSGGNIDLRGCALPKQLFERDIPAILVQHVDGLELNNVKIDWVNTRMPFFTHGIELDQFSNVGIKNFKGSASPIQPKAYRIKASNGKDLSVDNKGKDWKDNVH